MAGLLLFAARGGGGGSAEQAAPEPLTALVVGSPRGPIYEELASAYHVTVGDGTESDAGFTVLIYDGASVAPDQIESLPATDSFLFAGKIVIVLAPTQEDRQALESILGATALDDSPTLAVFDAFSRDGLLQTVNMVEFPTTQDEDPIQTDPPGPFSDLESNSLPTDDATLRAQTDQWRATYEGKQAEAKETVGKLSGVTPAQLAAAAADDGSDPSAPLAADSSTGKIGDTRNMDLSDWLAPTQDIPNANGSQFLTVQPFFHYLPKTFNLESIYYQPRFQSIFPKAVRAISGVADIRGACIFSPINASFSLPPAVITPPVVNVETATYRILQRIGGVYSHEVIARQFISSTPTVAPSTQPIGTESVSFCLKGIGIYSPLDGYASRECVTNVFGCNDFTETTPLTSSRGFNEQITSNFTWDTDTAKRVRLDSYLPKTVNGVTTVSSSQLYEKVVACSVQAALNGSVGEKGPNVGVSLGGGYGEMEKWSWSQGKSTTVTDWQVTAPGPGSLAPGATYDFYALTGPPTPNSLDNLQVASTPPSPPEPFPISFSGFPTGLNALQANGLESRNESDWSTKQIGGLLPAGKPTLTAGVTFNYGEVYTLYTLNYIFPALSPYGGFFPYGALHSVTVPGVPIQFDFGAAILQPPQPATWTIAASLNLTPMDRLFTVNGMITLNQANSTPTTLFLGAQLQPAGASFIPTPSVIRNLAKQIVIPADQTKAPFTAQAQAVGHPYNVRFYAFLPTGQQAGDDASSITVPSN